ncbi:hypothetical protein ACFL3E_02035 [Patescibacteria group bacterium]
MPEEQNKPQPEKQGEKKKSKIPVIRTLKTDAQELLKGQKVSFFELLSQEQAHKVKEQEFIKLKTKKSLKAPKIAIILVIIFAVIGGAGYFFISQQDTEEPPTERIPQPFIGASETSVIKVSANDINGLLEQLNRMRKESLFSGQLRYIPIEIINSNGSSYFADTEDFLKLTRLNPPKEFTDSIKESWNMFIYYYRTGEDIILVFETKSQERAFSGLLSWENEMSEELGYILNISKPSGITLFKDMVIQNIDTRILKLSSDSDKILGYAIFAGKLVIITTSQQSLEEMIKALTLGRVQI